MEKFIIKIIKLLINNNKKTININKNKIFKNELKILIKMFNNFEANEVRTKLLLKIESEIQHFKNSKTLINTILPKNIYNFYSNIEIKENIYEFSKPIIKENQKKFFDDSPISKNGTLSPCIETVKLINKITISEKKIKTFFDNLALDEKERNKIKEENNFNSTNILINLTTPKEILNSIIEEDKIHTSIKFLQKSAQNFINVISRKKIRSNTDCKRFYHNKQFKSEYNLRELKKPKKEIKTFNEIEDIIINNSPEIYVSREHEKRKASNNNNSNFYKNSIFKSSNNLNNKDKYSKISHIFFSNQNNNVIIISQKSSNNKI